MRKIVTMALCAVAALGATGAQAQDWRDNNHDRGGYQDGRGYDKGNYDKDRYNGGNNGWRGRNNVAQVCSGDRAHRLEDMLRDRVRAGAMDRGYARNIHGQIDNYEQAQRVACSRGDMRLINGLQYRYDHLQRAIMNYRGY
jgi:hypothetical protein